MRMHVYWSLLPLSLYAQLGAGLDRWMVMSYMMTSWHGSAFCTTTPGQDGCYFADDSFKHIFMNEKFYISIQISLKFIPKGPIGNFAALAQVMAWHWTGYWLNQYWHSSSMHMYGTGGRSFSVLSGWTSCWTNSWLISDTMTLMWCHCAVDRCFIGIHHPGIPLTNSFCIAIPIQWQFDHALNLFLTKWSLLSFVPDTAFLLSWHMPCCSDLIASN